MSTKIKDAVHNLNKIVLNHQDLIGQGSYAEVYRYSIENTSIAVKCFDNEEEALRERDVLQRIQDIATDCPGIIHYYGFKQLQIEIKGGPINQNYSGYAIFLEQCQSDLSKIKKLPVKEIFNLLSQISLSLFCLHCYGCFHGDLKPANILVHKKNQQQLNYYLTDYGQGKCIDELITTNYKTLSMGGTPFYFSPELWEIYNTRANFGRYNPIAADIYSLGVICIELLLGQQSVLKLNMARTQEQQYKKELQIIKEQLLKMNEFKKNPNNPLLITLLKMVTFHQKERPQAIEICQSLISSQLFSLEALETNNMKALIIQLISSFNPIIKINNTKDQQQTLTNSEQQIQINLQAIALPTFESYILKNSNYSSIIISLFHDSNVKFSKIHSQNNITKFDINMFHSCCDNKGSTLVIMHSNSEPNTFFGGMAIPSWQSPDKYYLASDPAEQSSWLFKIELKGEQLNLHQWKCIKKDRAIRCSKNYGPYFGDDSGYDYGYALTIDDDYSYSQLPSNNEYYKKQDLTSRLKDQKNLLFSLNKKISIKCPSTVIGKIMNEAQAKFKLSGCEVFTVKK